MPASRCSLGFEIKAMSVTPPSKQVKEDSGPASTTAERSLGSITQQQKRITRKNISHILFTLFPLCPWWSLFLQLFPHSCPDGSAYLDPLWPVCYTCRYPWNSLSSPKKVNWYDTRKLLWFRCRSAVSCAFRTDRTAEDSLLHFVISSLLRRPEGKLCSDPSYVFKESSSYTSVLLYRDLLTSI